MLIGFLKYRETDVSGMFNYRKNAITLRVISRLKRLYLQLKKTIYGLERLF